MNLMKETWLFWNVSSSVKLVKWSVGFSCCYELLGGMVDTSKEFQCIDSVGV